MNLVLAYIAISLIIVLSYMPLSSVTEAAATTTAIGTSATTITPIKHLIVIFQENISFDHYFGTYPHAANPDGQPNFIASANNNTSVDIDNLITSSRISDNPNLVKPFRLDRPKAGRDQKHEWWQA